jgi:hypothetical protein
MFDFHLLSGDLLLSLQHTHYTHAKIMQKTMSCINPFFSITLPILDLKSCLGSLKDALEILIFICFLKKNNVLMTKIACI